MSDRGGRGWGESEGTVTYVWWLGGAWGDSRAVAGGSWGESGGTRVRWLGEAWGNSRAVARGSLGGLTSGGWPASGSRCTHGTSSSSARSALSPPLDLRTQSGWVSASRLGLACHNTPLTDHWISGYHHPQTHTEGPGLAVSPAGVTLAQGWRSPRPVLRQWTTWALLGAWRPRPWPSVLPAGLFLAESPAAGLCTPPGRTGADGRAPGRCGNQMAGRRTQPDHGALDCTSLSGDQA